MKRNMLSILILALLVVNLAMNAFMLLSVMTTNNKTAKIISDISAALELEAGVELEEAGGISVHWAVNTMFCVTVQVLLG